MFKYNKYITITPVLGEENFPLKIHLEYGGTFIKLFMHVSSRNMFPTTRNLQIRVHVFRFSSRGIMIGNHRNKTTES
jgi:hypothetical protein